MSHFFDGVEQGAEKSVEELRGRLYATQALLVRAREEITRLERQLEYEATMDNREFWVAVEARRRAL